MTLVSLRKATVIISAIIVTTMPSLASAESLGDVSSQLSDANRRAAETSSRIADVDGQLEVVQAQINDTLQKIAETNAGIADARARMAAKQQVLGEYIRRQYTESNQTDLEILVGSTSISQFVNKQQYLESGQDKIAKVLEEVVKAKKELDARSAELAGLNARLAEAQKGLAYQKAQAEANLAQIEAARGELKAKLARYSGGRVVNVGDYVNSGDLIGFEGTSGCSTGPHLHFEVQVGGSPVNPHNYMGRLRWPLDDGFDVAQEFGPANWSAPYSFHTGIDLTAYFGAPVYAAASGVVSFSGYDGSGFGEHVQINHGSGLSTIYGHLGARASDYPHC
ncbi:MAG TPA: peptidoglycan DD-metalloendopeptidase family protein [Candidatus Saccharimonadales bacterium]|nr:peptidoglycan DD-metalloendopeptidase family protein [Candidatus Saccharimonadales bacterium]